MIEKKVCLFQVPLCLSVNSTVNLGGGGTFPFFLFGFFWGGDGGAGDSGFDCGDGGNENGDGGIFDSGENGDGGKEKGDGGNIDLWF